MDAHSFAASLRRLADALDSGRAEPEVFSMYPYRQIVVVGADTRQDGDDARIVELTDRLGHLEECCGGLREQVESSTAEMRLLLGKGGPATASADRKVLRAWLRGAETLLIADPYFLDPALKKGAHKSADEYADALVDLMPANLAYLEVYHFAGHKAVLERFKQGCDARGIKVASYPTDRIHDRVWIKDKDDARVIGTSFNSIGERLAFILRLPDEDRDEFKREMYVIKQSGAAASRARPRTGGSRADV